MTLGKSAISGILLIVVIAGLSLWLLLANRSPQDPSGSDAEGPEGPLSSASTPAPPERAVSVTYSSVSLEELTASIEDEALIHFLQTASTNSPEALQQAAANLRKRLGTDSSIKSQLIDILNHPKTSDALRIDIALLLGSLDDAANQLAIAEALKTHADSTDLASWLMLALGTWKGSPDFHERFAAPRNAPRVFESPGGLRVQVSGNITNPDVLELLGSFLDSSRPGEQRLTAAVALGRSLDTASVREAFQQGLLSESEIEIRGEYAEALSQWAEDANPAATSPVVSTLLKASLIPENTLVRLHGTPLLGALPLNDSQWQNLLDTVQLETAPSGVRNAALEIMTDQIRGDRSVDNANFFADLMNAATDSKWREQVLRQVPEITSGKEAVDLLVDHLNTDPAWNVRAAAIDGLTKTTVPESQLSEVLQALKQTAFDDSNNAVRKVARERLQAGVISEED